MDDSPLYIKSSYSLLSSTLTIDSLVDYARQKSWSTIAICDHQVLYGAIDFYRQAKAHNIQPIVGMSFDLQLLEDQNLQLALFAKNQSAFIQLSQWSTLLQTKAAHAKDFKAKMPELEDMVVVVDDQIMTAEKEDYIRSMLDLVNKSNEVYQGVKAEHSHLPSIMEGLEPLPFDCFTHLHPDDQPAVKVLESIKNKNKMTLDQLKEAPLKKSSYALDEADQLNQDPRALANYQKVLKSIELDLDLKGYQLPTFNLLADQSAEEYLEDLAVEGLKEKGLDTKVYRDRLNKELAVINQMGFANYFLIVWDIMAYAHSQSIQTGPGRGSAAGSLVAYALDIIEVDPVKYDLIFERFLNSERYSLPDIDLDFPDNKRQEIIAYIRRTYGDDRVASIITFGSLGAKQALRDTGRVLGLDSNQLKAWSQAVPAQAGISLVQAYKESKALRQMVRQSAFNQSLFKIACKIEGLIRNTSTHASGIVIGSHSLKDQLPLQLGAQEMLQTQYPMDDLEAIGLVKFDILGLKNLRILHEAVQFIQEEDKPPLDLSQIPLDDFQTFHLFQQADTNGIFQFESDGIKRVLRQLKPNDFEDIVAVIALYRPGPMNEISNYIDRKQGKQAIDYLHPDLEAILAKTKGIMIYQEQVMKIAQVMASYSLGEADMFRRAIGKKDSQLIENEKIKFTQGARENGYDPKLVDQVFHAIERFADYGFNRSHAVAYSLLAYQLAYLKAHYPHAFFAALLRSGQSHKKQIYFLEILKKDLKIRPPHVNLSYTHASCHHHQLVLGLDQIAGVKKTTSQDLINQRHKHGPYNDMIDFCQRLTIGKDKEEELQALVYAGAFDGLGQNRATLIHSMPSILDNLESGQFTSTLGDIFKPKYTPTEPLPAFKASEKELDYLSCSLLSHPNGSFGLLKSVFHYAYALELEVKQSYELLLCLHQIKRIQTKNGEAMAFLKVSDQTAMLEATLFAPAYRRYHNLLKEGEVYVMAVDTEKRKGKIQALIRHIIPAKEVLQAYKKAVFIQVDQLSGDLYHKIQQYCSNRKGYSPVYIHDQSNQQTFKLKPAFYLSISDAAIQPLKEWLGHENIVVTSTPQDSKDG